MQIFFQTFEVGKIIIVFFLEKVSYAHQGCIYLILNSKNSNIVKIVLHLIN